MGELLVLLLPATAMILAYTLADAKKGRLTCIGPSSGSIKGGLFENEILRIKFSFGSQKRIKSVSM